jgi:hypothetical protein
MDLVNKDLDALPEGTKGALVATVNSHGTVSVGVATKLGDGSWKLSGEVEFKLNKSKPNGYVGISKSW